MGRVYHAGKSNLTVFAVILGLVGAGTSCAFFEAVRPSQSSMVHATEHERRLVPDQLFNQPWMTEAGLSTVQLEQFDPSEPMLNGVDYSNKNLTHWLTNDGPTALCTTNPLDTPPVGAPNAVLLGFPTAYSEFGRWIGGNVSVGYAPTRSIHYIEPGAKLPVTGQDIAYLYSGDESPYWIFQIIYTPQCDSPDLRGSSFHAEGIVGLLHAAYYGDQAHVDAAVDYFQNLGGILHWTAIQGRP